MDSNYTIGIIQQLQGWGVPVSKAVEEVMDYLTRQTYKDIKGVDSVVGNLEVIIKEVAKKVRAETIEECVNACTIIGDGFRNKEKVESSELRAMYLINKASATTDCIQKIRGLNDE